MASDSISLPKGVCGFLNYIFSMHGAINQKGAKTVGVVVMDFIFHFGFRLWSYFIQEFE